MGVYVSSGKSWPWSERRAFDFPDVVHVLIGRGLPVAAYRSSGYWLDIGRREDYELAQPRFGALRDELLPGKGRV